MAISEQKQFRLGLWVFGFQIWAGQYRRSSWNRRDTWFGTRGLGFEVGHQEFKFGVWGFGFRISSFGFRV